MGYITTEFHGLLHLSWLHVVQELRNKRGKWRIKWVDSSEPEIRFCQTPRVVEILSVDVGVLVLGFRGPAA